MPQSRFETLKFDEWERMVDVNIKGVLDGIAAALPPMIARKSGQVINVASIAGHKVGMGSGVYAATKHAVRALSEGLRQEMTPHNIRGHDHLAGRGRDRPAGHDHRPGRRRARAQALRRGRDPGRQLRPRRRLRDLPAGGCRHQRDRLPPHPPGVRTQLARLRAGCVAPGPSGRCIITVSTQRPNLKPTAAKVPTCAKPSAAVQPDRAGVAAVADHRQHLPRPRRGAVGDRAARAAPARCRAASAPGSR